MDDLTLRYYEAEMRYLREAGKEFARAHPDRAAMLNLDKPGARDPYVERLFEGFAFLMGRLREKLDDDLPELTEGLVSLLWPHYMRTIPSLAIVEFSPDWRSLRQAEMLAEGFSVLSRPVGPHKTACQYRTTRDVPLQPLHLADARLHTETDGRSAIRLRFECPEKVDWSKAGIDKVAIFLNAESPVSSALHLAMTRRVHAMYARHAGTHTDVISLMAGANPWALMTMMDCGGKPIPPLAVTSCCWSISASVRSLCLLSYVDSTASGFLPQAPGLKSTSCSVKPGHPICLLKRKTSGCTVRRSLISLRWKPTL